MINKVLLFATLLALVSSQTTPFIQEVFLGKCYQKNPSGNVNCTALWTTFSQAAQISNYKVSSTNYIPFFALSNFSTPQDHAMLWEGLQLNAMLLASADNNQFTTVQDTSTGYIIGNLQWCGTTSNTFDYTNKCVYANNVSTSYFGMEGVWNLCSQYFAQGISGKLTILLQPTQLNNNGSYLAYRNTSMLAVSVQNLNITQITTISILVITNQTAAPYEVCNNGTVLNLTTTLEGLGLKQKITCIDDNEAIYKILCPPGFATSPQCLAALLAQSTTIPEKEKGYLAWALVMTISTASFLVLTVYFWLRTRTLEKDMRI